MNCGLVERDNIRRGGRHGAGRVLGGHSRLSCDPLAAGMVSKGGVHHSQIQYGICTYRQDVPEPDCAFGDLHVWAQLHLHRHSLDM